ncbi:hypothetical protein H6F32_15065 [Anabaena sp. FACHB-1237]|uniref:Ycf66 family protein n=1 Tax=Anabaena sp. FACHB-1237 TaxID=2692769 RepID=UPI00168067B4|nr:Ycf66 family protein [Anabaena sp. FACHB-1237]MBD2138862.1 hypothetical protein [Anabaena sp. FACHB-1237]
MLAYFLSLTVVLGSLAIYLSAFLLPEIHRKNDFIWSGVGFFYALTLWIFAPHITGGLLLGHLASVSLLVWFGWQTLSLRRQLVPEVQQTPLPSVALIKVSLQETISKLSVQKNWTKLQTFIGNFVGAVKNKAQKKTPVSPSQPVENIPELQEVVSSESPVEAVTDVSLSSESDTKLQTTVEVVSSESPVEAVTDVSLSSESDTKLQTTVEVVSSESPVEEVTDVSLSSESDTKLQTTVEVVSSESPVEEVTDLSLPSESDTKLQTTVDLSTMVEVVPVQKVLKENDSESVTQDIPLNKPNNPSC